MGVEEIVLESNAGVLVLAIPSEKGYSYKGWNLCANINPDWAKKALAIPPEKVTEILSKGGYKCQKSLIGPGFVEFSKRSSYGPVYMFEESTGGLLVNCGDLTRDFRFRDELECGGVVFYGSVNMDTRRQQNQEKNLFLRYIKMMNEIMR